MNNVAHTEGLFAQDPVIHEIFPTFGPKSGNTMLTIRGAFLDTGNKREVTIGKAACKIQRLVYLGFYHSLKLCPWSEVLVHCFLAVALMSHSNH